MVDRPVAAALDFGREAAAVSLNSFSLFSSICRILWCQNCLAADFSTQKKKVILAVLVAPPPPPRVSQPSQFGRALLNSFRSRRTHTHTTRKHFAPQKNCVPMSLLF